ncbi:TlpA disulfide reductase family protein [Massilia sp. ST3]|uniref:TlpA disulfide reductase family protein n=1 Tax=Massilia sp. ST3 TaxID=2824903 RepID=UPI001B8126D4|nr:TlpA disulfide reductase family protein [Massilia sp. ST3]MBQ5946064.1 TlpA family protein disulfide reductase [Massilia sp. ST3]
MDSLAFGPFVIPFQAALSVGAILLATTVADWFHRRRGLDAGPVLWKMIIAGFIAARAVFVLRHHDLYAAAPLGALDFRDGGFEATAGLLAACVIGAELVRRHAALRRPLLVSSLAGVALWLGGALLGQALAPASAPLPELTVRRLDGGEVSLHSFKGRPLVVNLWATWCPPCRREMPTFGQAQRSHPEVGFVYVNQGESAETVARFLAAQGLQLSNVVLDPAGRLAARTGAAGYPTTLFYNASGRLRMRHVGELSEATLRDKLAALARQR